MDTVWILVGIFIYVFIGFIITSAMDEWREFCKWIKELPYSELIIDISSLKSLEVGETITAEFKPKILFGEPFPWIKEDKED